MGSAIDRALLFCGTCPRDRECYRYLPLTKYQRGLTMGKWVTVGGTALELPDGETFITYYVLY